MYIDRERKAAFICHPKTGSSALGWVINKQMHLEKVGTHHTVEPQILGPDWKVGCVVRHPIDTLVSWYFYHRHFEGTFQEFLFREPSRWMRYGLFYGLPYATHVLRFEHLQKDWYSFCDEVGWTRYPIPVKNVSERRAGRHWQEFVVGCTIPDIKICDPEKRTPI